MDWHWDELVRFLVLLVHWVNYSNIVPLENHEIDLVVFAPVHWDIYNQLKCLREE